MMRRKRCVHVCPKGNSMKWIQIFSAWWTQIPFLVLLTLSPWNYLLGIHISIQVPFLFLFFHIILTLIINLLLLTTDKPMPKILQLLHSSNGLLFSFLLDPYYHQDTSSINFKLGDIFPCKDKLYMTQVNQMEIYKLSPFIANTYTSQHKLHMHNFHKLFTKFKYK